MTEITELKKEILQINVQLKNLLQAQEFEQLNVLLEHRLKQLKKLDHIVHQSALSEQAYADYHQFLQNIAEEDQQQMKLVTKERSALKKEAIQTSKGVKAVNAYHIVSKSHQK